MKDGSDAYPDDGRRSEDIPVRFYGVIDLSQYQYQGEPVKADNVTAIAIDDNNSVSWINPGLETLTTTPANPGPQVDYVTTAFQTTAVTTWKDGAATGVETILNASAYVATYTNRRDAFPFATLTTREAYYRWSLSTVNGAGIAAGSLMWSDLTQQFDPHPSPGQHLTQIYEVLRTYPDELSVPGAYLETLDPPASPPDNNWPYADDPVRIGLSYNRVSSGVGAGGGAVPVVKAGVLRYASAGSGGSGIEKRKPFRYAGSIPEVFPDDGVEPRQISNTALIVNYPPQDADGVPLAPKHVLWTNDGGIVQFNPTGIRLDAKAVNDSRQIVGAILTALTTTTTTSTPPSATGTAGAGSTPDERGQLGFRSVEDRMVRNQHVDVGGRGDVLESARGRTVGFEPETRGPFRRDVRRPVRHPVERGPAPVRRHVLRAVVGDGDQR